MGHAKAASSQPDPAYCEVFTHLEGVRNLPTLPEVVSRLETVLNDPNAGLRQVASLVGHDPAIAASILKIVNSPLYRTATTRPCTDIFSAVRRLGTAALRNIVLTTALLSAFSSSESKLFDRRGFWKHSISTGIAAQAIYDFCASSIPHRISKDQIHLGGVLHDLGKIVLEEHLTADFRHAIATANEQDISLHRAEQAVYGTDHAQVGAWLCRRWEIPEPLANVVEHHHDPERLPEGTSRTLGRIIHLANYVCHVHRIGSSGNPIGEFSAAVPRRLGLDMGRIGELMDVIEGETSRSEILLALA